MSCKSSALLRRKFWIVAGPPPRWCRSLSSPRRLCRWWYVRGAAAAAGSFVRLVLRPLRGCRRGLCGAAAAPLAGPLLLPLRSCSGAFVTLLLYSLGGGRLFPPRR